VKSISRREQVLVFGLAVPFGSALVTFVIGPEFLRPLPIWLKLVGMVACGGLIAAIAVYGRRRARRSPPRRLSSL